MGQSLMVVATESGTGKSVVSLGLVDHFGRHGARVCYFKPVSLSSNGAPDADALFLHHNLKLCTDPENMVALGCDEATAAIQEGRYDAMMDRILEAHGRLMEDKDILICEGVDSLKAFPSLDSDINIDIAKNIDATLLLVANGKDRTVEELVNHILMVSNQFQERGAEIFGVVVNRVEPSKHGEISDLLRRQLSAHDIKLYGVLPSLPILSRPRIADLVRALKAEVLAGEAHLNDLVGDVMVASMGLENALYHFTEKALIIAAGDREEILLAAGASHASPNVPTPCGIILTGGFEPRRKVMQLVQALTKGKMPILRVEAPTYRTAITVDSIEPVFAAHQEDKALAIRAATGEYLDIAKLVNTKLAPAHPVVTPRRFMRMLRERASSEKKTIVLPESDVERILYATAELRRLDAVNVVLLGDEEKIRARGRSLGLEFDEGVAFADPHHDARFEHYVATLLELRKHKGLPEDVARDLMRDRTYFATMMVQVGDADGMVSGSTTTTQATLRPAFEFVKTKPGFKVVSSVFFMCLPDKVLVYGDCAVNPNPNAEQLAEIADASAATARAFGMEPRVAMLSYSTGVSGKGTDVDLVREATELLRARNPSLLLEGPIQYDAATVPSVARTKLPDSPVAGQANVLIFPDLNTGNNTYKAVQRSAGAIAIGPVLQGLRKPVNDLSRGATITDIVNTVIVTAIQAQAEGEK
ncbi:phosphate acetyltransferase [Myxococcota bacterium]|nr:phosphate acetyltransferase [Myxococcota bacterium]